MSKDEIPCHHWKVPTSRFYCVDLLTKPRFWLLFDYNEYIQTLFNFFIMLIDFTEFELETIYNSLDDYIHYDDEDELPENLIGGLSVANRVESIQNKIDLVFKTNNKGAI